MTDLTVTDGLVSEGELSEVVAAHIGSDLDGSPVLTSIDLAHGSDHLGGDDCVSQVSLDSLGLLTVDLVLDAELQLLHEAGVLGVDSTSVSPALLGGEKCNHFLGVQLEELVEFNTTVDLLLERLSLGSLCSSLGACHD